MNTKNRRRMSLVAGSALVWTVVTASLPASMVSLGSSTQLYPTHGEGQVITFEHHPAWDALLVAYSIPPRPKYDPGRDGLSGDAAAVAACESGHRLPEGDAVPGTHDWSATNSRSSASGAFQFIDGTWAWVWESFVGSEAPAYRALDATPAQQLAAFEALWDGGRGASHWDASRSCWQQMIGDPADREPYGSSRERPQDAQHSGSSGSGSDPKLLEVWRALAGL